MSDQTFAPIAPAMGFAEAWSNAEFVQALLAQLSRFNPFALPDKLPGIEALGWHAATLTEHDSQ